MGLFGSYKFTVETELSLSDVVKVLKNNIETEKDWLTTKRYHGAVNEDNFIITGRFVPSTIYIIHGELEEKNKGTHISVKINENKKYPLIFFVLGLFMALIASINQPEKILFCFLTIFIGIFFIRLLIYIAFWMSVFWKKRKLIKMLKRGVTLLY